jgi:hypothetical protein
VNVGTSYYGDVRVGTVGKRTGVPNDVNGRQARRRRATAAVSRVKQRSRQELFLNSAILEFLEERSMKRGTPEEISKLKRLAQKHPVAHIAAGLGRRLAATIGKAYELQLSLRVKKPLGKEAASAEDETA